jgi:N-acetyltransferase 10
MRSLSRGKRAAGDLIPWTLSQQFADSNFASLSGARVVRIAVHPDLQGMGYGSRALSLLCDYYCGHATLLSEGVAPSLEATPTTHIDKGEGLLKETVVPRTDLPPLLCCLANRPPEAVDYVGVAYGLTLPLYRFWSRAGYIPVYLRQTPNDLTGEHSCIMVRCLSGDSQWLQDFHTDFRRRFLSLLSYQFRSFPPSLALTLLSPKSPPPSSPSLTHSEMLDLFSPYDLKRLDLYSRNMADHHLITDLLPALARLHFTDKTFHLSATQNAILMGLGLQHRAVESLEVGG